MIEVFLLPLFHCRHKTRMHIGQLVKDTSAKLKQASETDHGADVSVSLLPCLKNHSAVFFNIFPWLSYSFHHHDCIEYRFLILRIVSVLS